MSIPTPSPDSIAAAIAAATSPAAPYTLPSSVTDQALSSFAHIAGAVPTGITAKIGVLDSEMLQCLTWTFRSRCQYRQGCLVAILSSRGQHDLDRSLGSVLSFPRPTEPKGDSLGLFQS